jgi:hypothetical protein
MACASAGPAAIEYRDRRSAGKSPGDANPNNAGADDRNARLTADIRKVLRQARLPSLE